jgi:hypothetical protein
MLSNVSSGIRIRMLTYADVCSRMLTALKRLLRYPHRRRMLTYAHVCSRMLTALQRLLRHPHRRRRGCCCQRCHVYLLY